MWKLKAKISGLWLKRTVQEDSNASQNVIMKLNKYYYVHFQILTLKSNINFQQQSSSTKLTNDTTLHTKIINIV